MFRKVPFALLCGIGALISGCEASDSEAPPVLYHSTDQQYVDRALSSYSGNGKVPPEQVSRQVTPVVVHLPTMVCVGLNLKRGMAGGDTTLCYSKATGEQVLGYVNGE